MAYTTFVKEATFLTPALYEIDDILNLTGEFSILNISDFQNNSSVNGFGYTNVFSSSAEHSNKESKDDKEELKKLIPSVVNELEKAGKGKLLQKFFSQVSGRKFPLNNIAFQLWCDVVDWYENTDTRQMRYSPETLQFFWVGKKLFGGRFIRFMSGMKNETQQLTGNYVYDPQISKLNSPVRLKMSSISLKLVSKSLFLDECGV